jgi:hypothetical protein
MRELNNTMKKLEEYGLDLGDGIRDDIEEKYGTLGLMALESIPVAIGAVAGTIGRLTGSPEIIGVLPAIEIFAGSIPTHTARGFGRWTSGITLYGVGAALPYADKIYEVAQDLISRL